MRKEAIVILFVIIAGILCLVLSDHYASARLSGYSIYQPAVSVNCSDSAIVSLWSSMFKDDGAGIVIGKNISQTGDCISFFAYKNKSSELFLLNGQFIIIDSALLFKMNLTVISVSHENVTSAYLDLLRTDVYSALAMQPKANSVRSGNGVNTDYLIARNNSVTFDPAALTAPLFYATSTNWSQGRISNISIYQFAEFDQLPNFSSASAGQVFLNYSREAFYYINFSVNPYFIGISSLLDNFFPFPVNVSNDNFICVPNWTAYNLSCTSDEKYVVSFANSNNCFNLSSNPAPANITKYCDYNQNGVIGNKGVFDSLNPSMDLFINSSLFNDSNVFNGSKIVEIKEGDIIRVSFIFNFTNSSLDLNKIEVDHQSASSSFGFLIIHGLNLSKTITFDRVNSSSHSVCALNAEIESINNISENCDQTGEIAIPCPGINQSLNCSVTNTTFTVIGLSHSGVRELLPQVNVTSCTPNWQCGNWGPCIGNKQTRSCSEINACFNESEGMPALIQDCVSSCTPNWQCGNWTECTQEGNHTRICSDSNTCNSLSNKPLEFEQCTPPENNTSKTVILYIVITLISIAVIGGIIMSIFYLRNKDAVTSFREISAPSSQFKKDELF